MYGEDEEEGFEVEVVESGEPVVSEKELETETCGIVRGRSVEKLAVNAVLCPEAASAMELAEKDSQIVVSVGVEGLEEGIRILSPLVNLPHVHHKEEQEREERLEQPLLDVLASKGPSVVNQHSDTLVIE